MPGGKGTQRPTGSPPIGYDPRTNFGPNVFSQGYDGTSLPHMVSHPCTHGLHYHPNNGLLAV
eukprot:5748952-Karenia_brevis.AAC.1